MENRKVLVLGAIGGLVLLLLLPLLLGACLRGGNRPAAGNTNKNQPAQVAVENKSVTLWVLYDSQELYQGIIQKFMTDHPGMQVQFQSFTDAEEYHNRLVNDIAEGKGPDVAMIQNTWLLKDKNKFSPFPPGKGDITVKKYQEMFVSVAADDLILPDAEGMPQIYAFTPSVDTLAVYYNKKFFREYVQSRNYPADFWKTGGVDDLVSQVIKINHPDLSFERFSPAGIALGRSDNITYATDILSLLMLQYGAGLYDSELKTAALTNSTLIPESGQSVYLVRSALDLYTSFAIPQATNYYSWNEYITKKEKNEYEVGAFTSGKVGMILGYSSTMEKIKKSIADKRTKGKKVIEEDSVGIAPVPQVSATSGRVAYASYYPFVVTNTSQMKEEAWDLILDLSSEDAQRNYWTQVHKPTSLAALIDEQVVDPVFNAFAQQVSVAKSLKFVDTDKMKIILGKMIDDVVNGLSDTSKSVSDANQKVQCILDQYNKNPAREGVNCLETEAVGG